MAPFDPNKPNSSINQAQISPVPSEQQKDKDEKEGKTASSAGHSAGQPDQKVAENEPGTGKPKADRTTEKTLIGAGSGLSGDGSADGGINSGEAPDPKAKSKL